MQEAAAKAAFLNDREYFGFSMAVIAWPFETKGSNTETKAPRSGKFSRQ